MKGAAGKFLLFPRLAFHFQYFTLPLPSVLNGADPGLPSANVGWVPGFKYKENFKKDEAEGFI